VVSIPVNLCGICGRQSGICQVSLQVLRFSVVSIIPPSLTLREGRRLRVFENRVLRRIFGPKRDEVTGEWRKLHNGELNDLYCSRTIVRLIKSRKLRWARHVACLGERRGLHKVGRET
jgi:hypothetical protein